MVNIIYEQSTVSFSSVIAYNENDSEKKLILRNCFEFIIDDLELDSLKPSILACLNSNFDINLVIKDYSFIAIGNTIYSIKKRENKGKVFIQLNEENEQLIHKLINLLNKSSK